MIFVIDLFCGAGGVTEGIERAKAWNKKCARVVAAINHDPLAIKSHAVNHSNTWHFIEDIRTFDVSKLTALVGQLRKKYPLCKILLWASLECTNHSKAKGGLSRDGDSRTLCDHLDRYVVATNPDAVWIENVREFRDHGPIRIKSIFENEERCDLHWDFKKEQFLFIPYKEKRKLFFNEWRDRICSLGYEYEDRDLNSADFGEYTKRIRYFAQFVKPGFPLVWPEPSHAKNPMRGSGLKKWRPVKEVLDFSQEGKSIFNRKKNLSPKTMGRIYAGLIKYVAGGQDAFISKYYTGEPSSMNSSVQEPAHTITTKDHHSLIQTHFITKYLSNDKLTGVNAGADINAPCPTITTQNRLGLIQAKASLQPFIAKYYGSGGQLSSIDHPAGTLTTKDRMTLIAPVWLDKNYSNPSNHQSVDEPAGAITTKDHYSIIQATHFIDRQFGSGSKHQSVEVPAGALLTVPKMNLIKVETGVPFVMDTNFGNIGSSIDEPLPTILASRRQHYLVTSEEKSQGIVIFDPETSQYIIPIYDTDCESTVKIKQFMALYGISDIKMRMLYVQELKRIQGFPENYYLAGPLHQQKKFIGNSVTPKIPRAMIETTSKAIMKLTKNTFKIAA